MPERSLAWGTKALWRQLEPLLPGLSVEVVQRSASTNTALLERAHAAPGHSSRAAEQRHDDAKVQAQVRRSVESASFGRRSIDLLPCLLVAEHQTGGRGRQGRVWQAEPGASLTFSLALPLALDDWSGLSLAVGVALCEALDPAPRGAPGAHIVLKWPNDLWLVDAADGGLASARKLGGILIETVAVGSRRLLVVGVGINIKRFEARDLGNDLAAMSEIDAAATAPGVLARIALPLVHALQQFERAGFAAFAERFAALDALRDQPIRTTLAGLPEGVARGVSAQGALRVETGTGSVEVSSGEVSVRFAPRSQTAGP